MTTQPDMFPTPESDQAKEIKELNYEIRSLIKALKYEQDCHAITERKRIEAASLLHDVFRIEEYKETYYGEIGPEYRQHIEEVARVLEIELEPLVDNEEETG